jgi:hypothetical protein
MISHRSLLLHALTEALMCRIETMDAETWRYLVHRMGMVERVREMEADAV